jgi:hypothetical protein
LVGLLGLSSQPSTKIFFFIAFEKADSSAAFPCGAMNFIPELGIHFQIANSCTRRRGIFKGLSQEMGLADFSTNLRASLCRMDLISVGSILLHSTFYPIETVVK